MAAGDDQRVHRWVSATSAARPFPRFRIQSLMWVIALIAVGFALNRWLYPLLALLIMVFPSSVLLERLFGTRPRVTETRLPFSAFMVRLAALVACGCLCSAVAWYGSSEGVPTILSPMPLLVTAVAFTSDPNAWMAVFVFAFASFGVMNSYQLRWSSYSNIPSRFPILLSVATAFSVCLFAFGWQYGARYQGAFYTVASAAINLSLLIVLWGWWLGIRRKTSAAGALGFATVLHCWLFWFAFPYLGELP